MKITFTPEQWAELDNDFWSVDYKWTDTDGVQHDANTGEDDFRRLPEEVYIGEPGIEYASYDTDGNPEGAPVAYVIDHPGLTWEDEIILHTVLQERADFTQSVKGAGRGNRDKLRQAKWREMRQEAEQDSRRAERQELLKQGLEEGREDRLPERKLWRKQLRQEPRIADQIAARRAERGRSPQRRIQRRPGPSN